MSFSVRSSAFAEGSTIPRKYTLDGDNLSPPLEWHDAPNGTQSFVVLCEDPDAPSGTFRHWAMCNIDGAQTGLPEGAGSRADPHCRFARNDFGHTSYDGPRPPHGHGTHHYHFRVAALDCANVDVSPNESAEDLWDSIQPHVIAQAETIGTYQR